MFNGVITSTAFQRRPAETYTNAYQGPICIVRPADKENLVLLSEGRFKGILSDQLKASESEVIERFVKACIDAEGDTEKTGYMWSLSDVEDFAKGYVSQKK